MSFCIWFISLGIVFSGFIHFCSMYQYFVFMAEKYSIVGIYCISFIQSSVAATFWLLRIMLLWVLVSKYIFEALFSDLLVINIFSFWGTTKLFTQWLYHLTTSSSLWNAICIKVSLNCFSFLLNVIKAAILLKLEVSFE